MLDITDGKIQTDKHQLSILSCNIQSYNANHEKIKNLINDLGTPKILAFQELWQPKISTNIPGYHKPSELIRKNKRGGGVSIYCKSTLNYNQYEPINNIECNELEKIAIVVEDTKNKPYLIINCYRPPSSNFKTSMKELKKVIE